MKKLFFSSFLALAITISQIGFVFAQEPTPAPTTAAPITGTIQSITPETDSAGLTTVLVTFTDSTGATQTVRLSLDTATSLGLVTTDSTGAIVADTTKIGTDVTIDPATVIPDTTAEHPVGSALANFFSDLVGVDYDSIMSYHDDGAGFGVIAQALWMTNQLGGDTATFDAIMLAKQTGDYSAITLPDGSTPTNWGQFRKAVLGGNAKKNLGAIMSGHADSSSSSTESTDTTTGHGHGKGNGKGGSHGGGNHGKP